MGKVKAATSTEQRRVSERLALKSKPSAPEPKKRAIKRAPKPKKAKPAENGSKAEEPKAEAAEAK